MNDDEFYAQQEAGFGVDTPKPAVARWKDAGDMRVILRVPEAYLAGPAELLKEIGGILFPYTPSISYDSKATYATQQPMHTNYAQYFFQRSSVGPISITGKFTVQNEKDGTIFLAVQHLLRGLIKMPFGEDASAGSPPPVCRLDAFGDLMLSNVPVSVESFKFEFPDNVDYVAVGVNPNNAYLGHSMVPTLCTLSLTLNVMYSRQEIQNFTVDGWINDSIGGRGYL